MDKLEGYSKKEELIDLYERWKKDLEIKKFLDFLNLTGFEKIILNPNILEKMNITILEAIHWKNFVMTN